MNEEQRVQDLNITSYRQQTHIVSNFSSIRKIIFLDMDGVIATSENIQNGSWGITKRCQDLLGKILELTNAEIVISSSWRLDTVDDTKKYLTAKGFSFSDRIIGVTIRGYHYIQKGFPMSISRGVEIKQWIDNNVHRENGQGAFNRKELWKDYVYVILDDNSDMLLEQAPFFVRCDSEKGLTEKEMMVAVTILNGIAYY